MKAGLAETAARLRPEDRVSLWQFDSSCERTRAKGGGRARWFRSSTGSAAPDGGTELGAAIDAVARAGGGMCLS